MNWETKTNDSELNHYGVVGMKWGVVRNIKRLKQERDAKKLSKAAKDFASAKSLSDRTIRDYESIKKDPDADKELLRLYRTEELPAVKERTYQAYKRLEIAGDKYAKKYGDYSIHALTSDTRAISAGLNQYSKYKQQKVHVELDAVDVVDDHLWD